jgi:hypothetical protein
MDYAEQDAADLMELIGLFRDGADTGDCLKRISERWADEGRRGGEPETKTAPTMRDAMDLVQRLMAD